MSIRLAIPLISVLLSAPAFAETYQVVGTNTEYTQHLTRTETVVQAGALPINRFGYVELVESGLPEHQLEGVLVLLPGSGMNAASYEVTDGDGLESSFTGYLARKNIAVYSYSPRTTGIAAGECGVTLDCTPIQGWGLNTALDDVDYIVDRIQAEHPGKKIVIGGFSLGAVQTIAAVNRHPTRYAGALVWEGNLYATDAASRAQAQGICNNAQAAIGGGLYWDEQTLPFFKALAGLQLADPTGPTPFPLFPPGTTNRQAYLFALTSPNPNVPAPGLIEFAGSVAQDSLFFSDEDLVLSEIDSLNDLDSLVIIRDAACEIAGNTQVFTDDLGQMTAPVLAIESELGFGPYMGDNLALFGSASVEELFYPAFGHFDHLTNPDRKEVLDKPVRRWLHQVAFKD
jgi:pimeloyl-ACP methyl ester carboxylesterase